MMKKFLVPGGLLFLTLPAMAAPRVFLSPRPDDNPVNPKSGLIVAQLRDGHFQRLSATARCWNLKHAPDGKSWSWIEGEKIKLDRDDQTIFPMRIVVWRNGEKQGTRGTVIRQEKGYEVEYGWTDSAHIAVGSRGRHGVTHLQLYDARSGRCLEHRDDSQPNLPAWTKTFDRM